MPAGDRGSDRGHGRDKGRGPAGFPPPAARGERQAGDTVRVNAHHAAPAYPQGRGGSARRRAFHGAQPAGSAR